MSGYADALRVTKLKGRGVKSRLGDQITRWTIQGEIALADSEMDVSKYQFRVRWADLNATLPAGQMASKGRANRYQYKRPKGSESALVQAKFDLNKYRFTVVIEGANSQVDASEFQINFEKDAEIAFDESMLIELN
jgi:hypothetical protein